MQDARMPTWEYAPPCWVTQHMSVPNLSPSYVGMIIRLLENCKPICLIVDNPGYNSQEIMALFAPVSCFRWAFHEQGISTSVSWLPSLVHAPFTPALAWPRIPCQQPSPSQNALLASSFTSWAVQHLHQNTSWLHGIAKVGTDPRIRTAACRQPQPQG